MGGRDRGSSDVRAGRLRSQGIGAVSSERCAGSEHEMLYEQLATARVEPETRRSFFHLGGAETGGASALINER
jgi:hypothetical protein